MGQYAHQIAATSQDGHGRQMRRQLLPTCQYNTQSTIGRDQHY